MVTLTILTLYAQPNKGNDKMHKHFVPKVLYTRVHFFGDSSSIFIIQILVLNIGRSLGFN